jgi:hypothetical protein
MWHLDKSEGQKTNKTNRLNWMEMLENLLSGG